AAADFFDGARTIVDDRVDVAIGRRVAHADEHLKLIMHFKTRKIKPSRRWAQPRGNPILPCMHRWLVVLALAAWGCGKGEREAPEHDRAPDLQIVSAGSEPRR